MYSKIKARNPQEKQMRALENAAVAKTKKQKPKFNLKRYLNDNKYVYLMMFPVIVWFGIFCYWPITWIRMAFYDYSLTFGFSGSTFVLFNNFLDFFEGEFLHLLGNTLAINLLALVFLFPSAIVLALAFNEVRCKWYKRTLSVISYLPHFLSTAALVGFITSFLDPDSGLAGQVCDLLNIEYTNSLLYKADAFRGIQVVSGIWQTVGWNSIVYSAALTSIDPCLYEAAEIDGANKWQEIFSVTIPSILPTIVIMLIMRIGATMGSNFEKVYLMQNNGNLEKSEVIATYVYKMAFNEYNYGLSTAVGLFNSLVALLLVTVANVFSKKLAETSLW